MDALNTAPYRADDTLGGRIAQARDAAGLSVDEVASRIGVTAETFTEWETDRAEPRANKVMTLAGVLGISPAWLISGLGEAPDEMGLQAALGEISSEITRLSELNAGVNAGLATLEARLDALIDARRR